MNLRQWCDELNLDYHRVLCRILAGWDIERAFTEKIHPCYWKLKREAN